MVYANNKQHLEIFSEIRVMSGKLQFHWDHSYFRKKFQVQLVLKEGGK